MRAAPSIAFACFLLGAGLAGADEDARETPTTLADCDALIGEEPEQLESYRCYWFVARNHDRLEEAARRLESMLQLDPTNPHIQLILGAVVADLGQETAEDLYRKALEGYVAAEDARGEIYSRISLAIILRKRGETGRSAEQLQRALDLAVEVGDGGLEAQVRVSLGWQKYYEREYGRAWELLSAAERLVFPGGSIHQQLGTLGAMAAVCWALDRQSDALDYYGRMIELLRGSDPYREAGIRRNMALVARDLAAAGRLDKSELIRLQREALDSAIRAGNPLAAIGARLMLASSLPGEEGLEQGRIALAGARERGHLSETCWALGFVAERSLKLDPEHPEPAFAAVEEAIELARSRGDPEVLAQALEVRAGMRWTTGPRDLAIEESYAALDAIERIRDLQPGAEVRARVFGRFAHAYRDLANALLSGEDGLEQAFVTVERMRARSLLETLDAAGATVRREIAGTELDFAARRGGSVPLVEELQRGLEEDQALIAFIIDEQSRLDGWSGPSRSWAVIVDREEARAVRLPDCGALRRHVGLFLSLLERKDGSERTGAERLYRDLLGEPLGSLPGEITRLVVIPDGPLHRLPFGALVDPDDGSFLAWRYAISSAPSAATWLRWKRAEHEAHGSSLLAFADPTRRAKSTGEVRSGLGPLPYARREAAMLRRHLGSDGRVLVGEEATESALKRAAPAAYRLLHFASHAVVNDEHPDRSAVVLAPDPSAEDEDGLLRFEEVVDLHLDGQVVLLSTCRGAAGPLIGGEGMMGLANAFFQAGARTVVAGLWTVRDRETSMLIDRLGRHLAEGNSVSTALALARRELAERGLPPVAWASMIVLGDGDHVPFPGGRVGGWSRRVKLGSALAVVALLVVVGTILRRRPG